MSDPIGTALSGLRDQAPPEGFTPGPALRRRAQRRRTRRQVVTAGLAVLALAGGGTSWVANQAAHRVPDATGSAGPATSATPSVGPTGSAPAPHLDAEMFLTGTDLGAGRWEISQVTDDLGTDFWYWQDACRPYRRESYPALARRAEWNWRDFVRTDRDGVRLFQVIERYQPGAGPASLGEVRRRLTECGGVQGTDPVVGNLPYRWSVVAEHFAGDDALLAKHEVFPDSEPARVYYTVVVRVGDLVGTLALGDGETGAAARTLAARMAARL